MLTEGCTILYSHSRVTAQEKEGGGGGGRCLQSDSAPLLPSPPLLSKPLSLEVLGKVIGAGDVCIIEAVGLATACGGPVQRERGREGRGGEGGAPRASL